MPSRRNDRSSLRLEELENRLAPSVSGLDIEYAPHFPERFDYAHSHLGAILDWNQFEQSAQLGVAAGFTTTLEGVPREDGGVELQLVTSLYVLGSDRPDYVVLRQIDGQLMIDGFSGSVDASLIDRVILDTGGGDDLVLLHGETQSGHQALSVGLVIADLGTGNDTYVGTSNVNCMEWVAGGTGRDLLYSNGGSTSDQFDGGDGDNDFIFAHAGQELVDGGKGVDVVYHYDNWINQNASPGLRVAAYRLTQEYRAYMSDGTVFHVQDQLLVLGTDNADEVVLLSRDGRLQVRGFLGSVAIEDLAFSSIDTFGGDDLVRLDSESFAGHDVLNIRYYPVSVELGEGNDVFYGSAGVDSMDWVWGDGGNDRIYSRGGDYDKLRGGTGDDEIFAGAALCWMDGNDGEDRLVGTPGTPEGIVEVMHGGQHFDRLVMGAASYAIESRGVDAFFGVEDGHPLFPIELELVGREEREELGVPEELDGIRNPRVWKRSEPEDEEPDEEEEEEREPDISYFYRIAQRDWNRGEVPPTPSTDPKKDHDNGVREYHWPKTQGNRDEVVGGKGSSGSSTNSPRGGGSSAGAGSGGSGQASTEVSGTVLTPGLSGGRGSGGSSSSGTTASGGVGSLPKGSGGGFRDTVDDRGGIALDPKRMEAIGQPQGGAPRPGQYVQPPEPQYDPRPIGGERRFELEARENTTAEPMPPLTTRATVTQEPVTEPGERGVSRAVKAAAGGVAFVGGIVLAVKKRRQGQQSSGKGTPPEVQLEVEAKVLKPNVPPPPKPFGFDFSPLAGIFEALGDLAEAFKDFYETLAELLRLCYAVLTDYQHVRNDPHLLQKIRGLKRKLAGLTAVLKKGAGHIEQVADTLSWAETAMKLADVADGLLSKDREKFTDGASDLFEDVLADKMGDKGTKVLTDLATKVLPGGTIIRIVAGEAIDRVGEMVKEGVKTLYKQQGEGGVKELLRKQFDVLTGNAP